MYASGAVTAYLNDARNHVTAELTSAEVDVIMRCIKHILFLDSNIHSMLYTQAPHNLTNTCVAFLFKVQTELGLAWFRD